MLRNKMDIKRLASLLIHFVIGMTIWHKLFFAAFDSEYTTKNAFSLFLLAGKSRGERSGTLYLWSFA